MEKEMEGFDEDEFTQDELAALEDIAELQSDDTEYSGKVRALWNAFCVFDEDNSFTLDASELTRILVRPGEAPLSDAEAGEIIEDLDKNGDGVLDFKEFICHFLPEPEWIDPAKAEGMCPNSHFASSKDAAVAPHCCARCKEEGPEKPFHDKLDDTCSRRVVQWPMKIAEPPKKELLDAWEQIWATKTTLDPKDGQQKIDLDGFMEGTRVRVQNTVSLLFSCCDFERDGKLDKAEFFLALNFLVFGMSLAKRCNTKLSEVVPRICPPYLRPAGKSYMPDLDGRYNTHQKVHL